MENEQDPYNPYSSSSASLIPSLINRYSIGLNEAKPIQYFGRYNFPDATSAAKFIQTPQFTGFWDRNNVGINNIGIRSELNDAGRYNHPRVPMTYETEVAINREILARRLAQNKIDPAIAQKMYENKMVSDRSAGRFYTQQGLPTSVKDTSYYLTSSNSQLDEGATPVRVIADKRLSRFSLSNRLPWNGRFEGMSVANAQGLNRQSDLSRVVGKDLGASLSSNPRSESFVSSQMAKPAAQGGESRVAGRVNNASGQVELIGKPKVPVALQQAGNVLSKVGTFMNYAGLIPLVTSETKRAKSDYENPVTGDVYKKDEVVDIGGLKFPTSDVQTIAIFHPDNADQHPEITDEMRKKFNPDWFKKKKE